MNKPLSTKDKIEIGIFRFLNDFQGCERLEKYIK